MRGREGQVAPIEDTFGGTERYEIRRRIGSGSFGVVYEAFDHVRKTPVALKWLKYVEPDAIFRFKNEFRRLAEISHPNLVTLFDLESDGNAWFFTMELVRGVPIHTYLRPELRAPDAGTWGGSSAILEKRAARMRAAAVAAAATLVPGDRQPIDVELSEVRDTFRQLAVAVFALHEAGKLHRDLKCQNVLVTPTGRVVLLDFGMVRDLRRPSQSDGLDIAGTPLYMAAEQCAGAPTGPPADWYAFGVMLFRALTGELPFVGRLFQVMSEKQKRDGDPPSELAKGVPTDLDELCGALLQRDPDKRPGGLDILGALDAQPTARTSYPSLDAEVFVGRRRQLRALEAARRRVSDGLATAVYVHGPSGIGKTALVHHFLDRIIADDPDALVLRGRCYERETLPYKALDSVVDDLVQQLRQWTDEECERILPPDAQDLVRVFPMMARIDAFERATRTPTAATDPQEQRRRAVAAFEHVLHRVAERGHVVVFMDDLQWGDGDSAQLVRPLLHGPDDPPVFWIGTYRTDEAEGSGYLSAMHGIEDTDASTMYIEVPELDEEEARTLLELRLSDRARTEALLDDLARDAAGSPLLIDLLVRHAREPDHDEPTDLALVLQQRMAELADEAQDLLAVLALRGRPVEVGLAASLVGVEAFDLRLLTQLRNMKLLRGDDVLELYHDRIRETVTSGFSPEFEKALHQRLADGLVVQGDVDPEALARHYAGAEAWAQAFDHTVEAAGRAVQILAFDRAAELYHSAIRLRDRVDDAVAEPDVGTLRVSLADTLRNAGRGADAAKAYLDAAEAASSRSAQELRRLGAEQFLFSGHIDEGRTVLRSILQEVGIGFPEHPALTLAEFLLRRGQVRLRGLGFREQDQDHISAEDNFKIDVCWSVSVGLAMIDPVRAGVFQARHLLMALDVGDTARVARAVAVEVPFSALSGSVNNKQTEELMHVGRKLAERSGDPYARALLASSSGGARWLQGRWDDVIDRQENALKLLRGECTGVAWELSNSAFVLLDSLWRMGRWPELLERWPDMLDDAVSRGDLLLEIQCRIKFGSLTCLVEDRPDDAIHEARLAVSRWSQADFTLMHLWEIFSSSEAQLYAGRADTAYARVAAEHPTVNRSGLLRLQMYDVTWRDLQGRSALSCAERAHGRRRRKLLSEASAAAKKIAKTKAPWGQGLAATLRAGVASLRGDRQDATRELERAERAFFDSDMSLHATVVRCRLAELEGSTERTEAGLEALAALGLEVPQRWLALLAPGEWHG